MKMMRPLDKELYGISKGLRSGDFSVPDIGDIVPAALMLHDLDGLQPVGCSYMNNWGCEHLGSSANEVNELGEAYYEKYFVKEESFAIFQGMNNYLELGDFDKQYNFFQRVRLYGETDYSWFYTVCKVVQVKAAAGPENKIILLSSPVIGMDALIARVNRTLDQDTYIRANYRRFAALTSREKEIITLLANGKSTNEMAGQLFISAHTVSTHRKNIFRKIECKSFAELLRFAIAFDLV
ncbi:LuxR C-terminal-related transcriptional regulator [Chitinophaga alhagiae]|uniref:LuxR C-terminal-related transcriptional regulator n=1 Tax=Chitinophaga alhagiae TaxID=2203219 RepID=UPI000E5A444E|nr:LuxR C-terminal-related transcriptional regulator [Chitinophaga alhagiae]